MLIFESTDKYIWQRVLNHVRIVGKILVVEWGNSMRNKKANENSGYCRECSENGIVTSIKLRRRDFVKAAGAGAFYLILPDLSAIPQMDGIELNNLISDQAQDEPLVVIVKGDELIGFRGMEEFIVKDRGLIEKLSRRSGDEPESDDPESGYGGEDTIVVLLKKDKSIKFRGLGEYVLADNDLGRRLTGKFGAGG